MNQDILQGNWEEMKGKMKQTWGWLSDNDLTEIEGDRQEILGKLQKHYGYTRQDAERAIKEWQSSWH